MAIRYLFTQASDDQISESKFSENLVEKNKEKYLSTDYISIRFFYELMDYNLDNAIYKNIIIGQKIRDSYSQNTNSTDLPFGVLDTIVCAELLIELTEFKKNLVQAEKQEILNQVISVFCDAIDNGRNVIFVRG